MFFLIRLYSIQQNIHSIIVHPYQTPKKYEKERF